MAQETFGAGWAPGLWGYVLFSMLMHVVLFAAASQYRAAPDTIQTAPVLVRLITLPLPSPPAPVPARAPETMDALPDFSTGTESAIDRISVESAEPAAPVPDEQERPDAMEGDVGRPGRDALFDPDIIAQRAVEPAETAKEKTGITFDTGDVVISGYMGRLKRKVEDAWHYPYSAIKEGISGDLKISFVVRRDGTLGAVRVVRTSGHPELDKAAMQALRDAEPFWPLPELFEKEALTVDGRFIYTLKGSRHIR